MRLEVILSDGAPLPRHAKSGDAGLDLTSRKDVTIPPSTTRMVGTGVRCAIPDGYFGLVAPRSSTAAKKGVTLANSPSIIDSGYRGEIMLPLRNMDPWHDAKVERGERVAQMVLLEYATCECVEVDELDSTERGEGGFGSSGVTMVDLDGEVVG